MKGHKMQKIGYARVSSTDQNLDRQIAALRGEGCAKIYREKASGKDMRNRRELGKAIDALPTKGVLVLAEWDRCTRSLMDGIEIMRRINERGAFIVDVRSAGAGRPGESAKLVPHIRRSDQWRPDVRVPHWRRHVAGQAAWDRR